MITMLKSVSCNRDALFGVAAEDIKGNSSFSCFAGGHVWMPVPPSCRRQQHDAETGRAVHRNPRRRVVQGGGLMGRGRLRSHVKRGDKGTSSLNDFS